VSYARKQERVSSCRYHIPEQRRLRDDEYPLLVRVMLGPHEDVAKLFLMDRQNTEEISNEVAQFLNLSTAECRAILGRYQEEEDREAKRVKAK
jgi:Ras association domain-containing protein 2/4